MSCDGVRGAMFGRKLWSVDLSPRHLCSCCWSSTPRRPSDEPAYKVAAVQENGSHDKPRETGSDAPARRSAKGTGPCGVTGVPGSGGNAPGDPGLTTRTRGDGESSSVTGCTATITQSIVSYIIYVYDI